MATSLSAYELNVKQYKKLNDWTYTLPMFILYGDGSIISYLLIGWQLSYTGLYCMEMVALYLTYGLVDSFHTQVFIVNLTR